jgi:hypothetical protein
MLKQVEIFVLSDLFSADYPMGSGVGAFRGDCTRTAAG